MAQFFKTSRTWVVDFLYDGKARRCFRILPDGEDARAAAQAELEELHGGRARLVGVRAATEEEEREYLRGEEPRNAFCPVR